MSEWRFPWPTEPSPPPPVTPPPAAPLAPKKRGRRPASQPVGQSEWLACRLSVTGAADDVASFAEAARGPGRTPWHVDYERIEEDAFHLALRTPPARRSLSVEGCRTLARQFRDALQARARAPSLAQSFACPFDLHTLLPVPPEILSLERDDPLAVAWLMASWGVFELRRVTLDIPPATPLAKPGQAVVGYRFWAVGGDGPGKAIARLAAHWADLDIRLTS